MKISNLKHTLSIIAALLLVTAIFQACKKDKSKRNLAYEAKDVTANFGRQAQQFKIIATLGETTKAELQHKLLTI